MKKITSVIVTMIMLCVILTVIFIFTHMNQEISLQNPEKPVEKVQLRFMSSWTGTDTKADKLEEILIEFQNENPNIEVMNESMAGEEFLFILKTDFASGNDPDVFGLWPGSDIRELIKAGKVADLTKVLADDLEWKANFKDEGWEYSTFNNKIYGLPVEIIYECLFINKDLFDQYQIRIPHTYDDLLEAVRRFAEVGVIPIACNSTPEGSYLYQNIVMKLGGKENTEEPFDRQGKIKPQFIEGMEYMKELYELGAFPPDFFTMDDNSRNQLFLDKKAAMIVQGAWFIGKGAVDSNDKTIGLLPFPSFSEGLAHPTAITYGIGNGNFHMSSNAWNDDKKHPAALKLLKAITSVRSAKIIADKTGFISNIYIPDRDMVSNPLFKRGKELVDSAEELIGPTDSFIDRTCWEEILVKHFPQVLEDEMTPEEVFTEIEKRVNNH